MYTNHNIEEDSKQVHININIKVDMLIQIEKTERFWKEEKEKEKESAREYIENEVQEMWNTKKYYNMLLADTYGHIFGAENKVYRLLNCGRWLEYGIKGNLSKLIKVSSCHVRLCPICQYKRSLALFRNTKRIYEVIEQEKKYKHLLLTLTVRNVKSDCLRDTISNLLKGWRKLSNQRLWKRIIVGYLRTIEITYNEKNNTYHPHIHILLTVLKEYGSGNTEYLTVYDIQERWKKAMQIDYAPIVHIKRVYVSSKKPLLETTKYTVKPAEYHNILEDGGELAVEVVETLDDALSHRRLTEVGGIVRKIKQELKIQDMEEEEEKNYLPEDFDERIIYQWFFSEYKYKKVK